MEFLRNTGELAGKELAQAPLAALHAQDERRSGIPPRKEDAQPVDPFM
jgi:hypothetical protein